MGLIETIQTGKRQKPPRLMLYGTEGIGKSTFAASAPRPIFIATEDGLGEIICESFPLATSLGAVQQSLTALIEEPHEYQACVVDSLDWLEQLVWDAVCREKNVRNIEDVGYAKGYVLAMNHWRDVLDQLGRLRDERGMAIILIAHAKVEKFDDPESAAYDRYSPRLHKHAMAIITEWCDAVLFATRRFRIQTEDAGFGRERTIAVGIGSDGGERVIRTVGGPSCIAKNRYNLPYEIPLSWVAFVEALAFNQQPIEQENSHV